MALCMLQDEEFCKPKAVGFFNDIMRSRRKIDEVKGDMEGFSSYEELEKVMEGEEGQIHLPRPFIYEDVSKVQVVFSVNQGIEGCMCSR